MMSVNPHLEILRSESAVSATDVAWNHWLVNVEHELGHELDGGDADFDGYSLETAYAFFEDGLTEAEAVEEFMCMKEEVALG